MKRWLVFLKKKKHEENLQALATPVNSVDA